MDRYNKNSWRDSQIESEELSKMRSNFEESKIQKDNFEYVESDIVEQEFEHEGSWLLKKYLYEENRKKDVNKVIISSLIYFFAMNIFQLFIEPFILSGIITDKGIIMTILVGLSMFVIFQYIGKENMDGLKFVGKKKFGIKQFIFFAGFMYILSIIFSLVTMFIMDSFGVSSPDVTSEINNNLNAPLLFYSVLFGPLMEEIQYRGWYVNKIRKYGVYTTIILTGIIFSFSHWNFLQGFGTLGIGFLLGYIAYYYGFKYAVLMHIWNNALVFLIFQSGLGESQDVMTLPQVIISILIFVLLINSLINLLRKNVRNEIKQTLKLTDENKETLKFLFTNWLFYAYLIFMIIVMVYTGKAASEMI